MLKHLGILFCMLYATASFALQTKAMRDNQTALIKVSAKELTRIFVEGDRIQSARGLDGNYQLTKDEAQGAIFIKPNQSRPFNLFLTTEAGHNYTLLLTPIDIPSEVIQIKPLSPVKAKAEPWEKNTPYSDAIIQLMKTMVSAAPLPDGYALIHVNANKPKKLHLGITVQLKTIYQGNELQGEIWQVKNRHCRSMTLKKSDFYRPHVRAIALKNNVVSNCGSTYLYRVVGR